MSITQITERETALTNTLRQMTEALTLVTAERDALRAALKKLLANADWRVGGTLTPESKRSDYQSSGCSTVKTRDLASIRDAMKGKS